MTVSTSTNSVTYVATGATNIFDYDFVVYDESHFIITLDGVEVTSGFTVTGLSDESGGTVVFDSNPTGTLVILRQVPFTQDIDYSPYDPFPAETHERGLDLGVMRDQQLKTEVDQAQADADALKIQIDGLVDEVTEQADRAESAADAAETVLENLGPARVDWTFTTGGVFQYPNEAAFNSADGNYYSYIGPNPFPVTVAPGTNPVSNVLYQPRTDVLLRDEYNDRMVYTPKRFATVASMVAGAAALALGDYVQCDQFHADVALQSPNQYEITTDTPDGMFVIDLGGGKSATLQYNVAQLFIERVGAKPDLFSDASTGAINSSKTDSLPIFNAAKAKGATILAFGAYYMSGKLDMGNNSTEKRAKILGDRCRNFDGFGSTLGFDHAGDGVEFFAGAEAHNLLLYKFGGNQKTGIGILSNNTHAADLSNITCRGWERGGDSFTWMSVHRGCIAYLCKHGFRLKTDSTSATHIGCYVRECDDTGFDIDNCGYTPLIGCGVDNTPKPYVLNTANGVSLISCGAEFTSGKAYSGFIWVRGTGYVNLQILGGKWLIAGASTCAHFIYSTFAGTELAEISISGLGSKANLSLTGALVNAKANVFLSDDCHLGSTTALLAVGGGMLVYNGKSIGSRRPIKQFRVANSGGTPDITSNGYCRIQRVVNIADLGTNVLYVEVPAQLATSITRGTIRVTPIAGGEANGESVSAFGTVGSYNGHFYNEVGAGVLLKRNNTLGNNNQSFVIDKSKWVNRVIVDVEIEGITDTDDTMVSIAVSAPQWP